MLILLTDCIRQSAECSARHRVTSSFVTRCLAEHSADRLMQASCNVCIAGQSSLSISKFSRLLCIVHLCVFKVHGHGQTHSRNFCRFKLDI